MQYLTSVFQAFMKAINVLSAYKKSYFYNSSDWSDNVIFKRKIAVILAVVLCLAVLSAAVAKGYEYIAVAGTANERQVIILDAGHGGLVNTTD